LPPRLDLPYAGGVTAAFPPSTRAVIAVERAAAKFFLTRPALTAALAWTRVQKRDGRALDPQTAAMLALEQVDPGAGKTSDPPAVARRRMAASIATVAPPPVLGVTTEPLTATSPAGPIPMRLYTPAGVIAPAPAVVYYHGGGFVTGDLETHDGFCRRLAVGARCRVVAVDYRLAPEHRFPAAVEDAVAAFRWVAQRCGDLGIDAARIAVAGDSAGGNLSAVISIKTREDARRPCLQVLMYPAVDLTCTDPSHAEMGNGYFLTSDLIAWYLRHYAPGVDRRNPDLSPIYAPDLRGAAPALIYSAGFDPLRDEALRYAERLREAEVPVRHWEFPSLIHGFALMGGMIDGARRATDEIIADVRRALGG
jgi:acetyl esterase